MRLRVRKWSAISRTEPGRSLSGGLARNLPVDCKPAGSALPQSPFVSLRHQQTTAAPKTASHCCCSYSGMIDHTGNQSEQRPRHNRWRTSLNSDSAGIRRTSYSSSRSGSVNGGISETPLNVIMLVSRVQPAEKMRLQHNSSHLSRGFMSLSERKDRNQWTGGSVKTAVLSQMTTG